ncbi:hydrogenase maturation protease [Planctomycetales bacterium ZRK34]|nr:hydrogenase maturation protease [Planctomycetales bacterium ZRK34]
MIASVSPILVASCGNVMATDDGFGPAVIAALQQHNLPGVQAINLDIRPAALLDYLADRKALILVDAALSPDCRAGQLLDMDWHDPQRPPLVDDDALSTHGLSISSQLELAARLRLAPKTVRLIAATIGSVEHGPCIGEMVRDLIKPAVHVIAGHALKWMDDLGGKPHA